MPEYNGAMKKKEKEIAAAGAATKAKWISEWPAKCKKKKKAAQRGSKRVAARGGERKEKGNWGGKLHKKLTFTLAQSQPIWPIATSVAAALLLLCIFPFPAFPFFDKTLEISFSIF